MRTTLGLKIVPAIVVNICNSNKLGPPIAPATGDNTDNMEQQRQQQQQQEYRARKPPSETNKSGFSVTATNLISSTAVNDKLPSQQAKLHSSSSSPNGKLACSLNPKSRLIVDPFKIRDDRAKGEATLVVISAGSTTREEAQKNRTRAKNTSGSTTPYNYRVHNNAIAEGLEILKTSASLIDNSTMNKMLEEVKMHQVIRFQHDDMQEQVRKGQNVDSQTSEQRAYWKPWSRVMELVQASNIDSTYVEVLGSRDELIIKRLMNKTGYVLDKPSARTTNKTVTMLLR